MTKFLHFLSISLIFAAALCCCGCKIDNIESCENVRFLVSKSGCTTNDWQFQYNGKWYPATVPGNIHDDLLQNGLIPDPHFGTNEDSVQWVSDSTWTYRLFFDKECLSERSYGHHQLVFQGLDTYAEIYLNGKRLQSVDGTEMPNNMFREWAFDVEEKLKEKDNELIVKFLPTAPFDSLGKSKVPFQMPDTRVFTRKAQYESGWDWGPKINTCGIWKVVYLRSWKYFKKNNLYIYDTKPTLDTNGVWECMVELDVEAEKKMKVDVCITVVPPAMDSLDSTNLLGQKNTRVIQRKVRLQKGHNKISVPVKIKHPKLWWPNGMGEPNLYTFYARINYKGNVYYDSNLPNSEIVQHGLRTIELKREKDDIGESFAFVVNGKPCFMRGADWIPATSYPGKMQRQDGNDLYYQLLHDAQEVNMNMIRVWGGGLYEDDAFYSYCDQFGLLVWQDFMYACNPYPGDDAFLKNAKTEAIEQVRRLRNHACMAIWCGNNEIHNGLEDWGWQQALNWTDAQNKQLYQDFHNLFEKTLPEVLKDNFHNANYVSSSPTFGWGHDECCTHGCSHYWGVWWGEMPFSIWPEKTGRFMTEYGFQSYPEMATIEAFTTPEERHLGSPSLNNHQKHGRGVEIIRKAMAEDFHYTKTDDLDDFAYVSQLVQAEGIVQAIDAHRIQHDKCRGTLYWQLNDCWPVASWSSIDATGRWKALHYRLKEAYANVAIAVQHHEDNTLDVYLINDGLKAMKGELKVSAYEVSGSKFQVSSFKGEVGADKATKVCVLRPDDFKDVAANRIALKLQFVVDGKAVAERIAYFVKPGELQWTKGDIQQKIENHGDYLEITLTSPTLQYGVQLTEATGKEVKWSDNYFDLLPNEPKTVRCYYDDLNGEKPKVKVRGEK